MPNKKVLVTGATGYIAKHIILKLLEDGYQVRGSVRNLSRGDDVRATLAKHVSSGINLDDALEFVALNLSEDDGWDEALEGVDILMHTASPVPVAQPKNHDEIIKPAVEGCLRALNAAHKAGIKRVVMTSSVAAVMHHQDISPRTTLDERDWNDLNPKYVTAYSKSKTLAEQAAWEFVKRQDIDIDLTTINPGMVLGAPLDDKIGASVSIIERIMTRKDPAVPNLGFAFVSVSDVAEMHVNAIDTEASFGNRYIAVERFVWFYEIVEALNVEFPTRKINTFRAPNWFIKFIAIFDADVRSVSQDLGLKREVDNLAARRDLGIEFKNTISTAIETAHYMVENKMV